MNLEPDLRLPRQEKVWMFAGHRNGLLHKLYNYDILVSFAAFIRVVTQRPSPLLY